MRLTFTLHDVQEISSSAYRAFISTFHYTSNESDSDLSDFDPDSFGCGEITPEVEDMVKNSWEICDPLGEDRGLITTCTAVCYWCCCETVKKVSPIIAEATTNLIY